jgi:SAM-dependent methyltransferase
MVAADISCLPFVERRFAAVLAFGLYHNLEQGIETTLAETRRVLQAGGLLCASIRADNLQNRIIDWLANRGSTTHQQVFHKANYRYDEVQTLFRKAGFEILRIEYVENMPFMYKFSAFRHRTHRMFDEHKARAEGYCLSPFGEALQRMLVRLWPASFCNIFLITVRRSDVS